MIRTKLTLLVLITVIAVDPALYAQQPLPLVPMPASVQAGKALYPINRNAVIFLDGTGMESAAAFLVNEVRKMTGYRLPITDRRPAGYAIRLGYERLDHPFPGAYKLNTSLKGIEIMGDNEAGVFYGVQTLIQLISKQTKGKNTGFFVPHVKITDQPRLQYRGMHLDVARHFFTVAEVKRYIDYLAYHKMNTLHWHLTEDQGWRIEIKKYPELTRKGAYRNGTIVGRYPGSRNDSTVYGGYYTQAQVKEIITYAANRYITVIPEIEMPGHASAAIAAYPELSCFPNESTAILNETPWAGSKSGKQVQQTWGVFEDVLCPTESTFKFLEGVLDEVIALFPSPYIHIGGDECPKESWKRSAFCQQLIKDSSLKDEHGLQSYFIRRIERYVNSKGKQIIGWDEILDGGLAPNATVMSWRGEKGGIAAAKQKHAVIMTPESPLYLNHAQSAQEDSITQGGFNPLDKVYNYEAIPAQLNAEEAQYVLGAQGNMWSEYLRNMRKLEYMLFPRMSALSEALWSPKEIRNWESFEQRLPAIMRRYESWGANYSKAYYDLRSSIKPTEDFNGIYLSFESRNKTDKIIYLNGHTHSATYPYTGPIRITQESEYGAVITDNENRLIGSWKWNRFFFNKATGKKITLKYPPSPAYPGTGAFTLVNGVITERNLLQSTEWLGFSGKDMEAVIDLGKDDLIKKVRVNILHQEGSWIYAPASVEILISDNGIDYASMRTIRPGSDGYIMDKRRIEADLDNTAARYIKVIAKNYGTIPAGKAGAGHPAWLFVDEIEIE